MYEEQRQYVNSLQISVFLNYRCNPNIPFGNVWNENQWGNVCVCVYVELKTMLASWFLCNNTSANYFIFVTLF